MIRTLYVWYFTILDWVLGEPDMIDDVHYNAHTQRIECFDGHWLDVVPVTRREKRPRSPTVLRTFSGYKVLKHSYGCPLYPQFDFLKGATVTEARASYQVLNIQRRIPGALLA